MSAREKNKQSPEYSQFSMHLKGAMEEQGLTQNDVAELVGLERTAVAKIINRLVGVTISRADRFAEAVGYELWEMLREELPEQAEYKVSRRSRCIAAEVFVASLNAVLESHGYGKTEFAEALGLQRPNLYRVLDNTEDIGILRAARFADGLGYHLSDMLNPQSDFTAEDE